MVKNATRLIVCASAIVSSLSLGAAGQSDGKSVFMARCQKCHSVTSESIPSGGFEQTLNINWKSQCNECTPDLSGVGERRKPDWLKAYLKNKKKGRNGLKHNQVPFISENGKALIVEDTAGAGMLPVLTDEDMEAVVAWLVTVKKTTETAPAGIVQPPPPPRPSAPPQSRAKAASLPKEEAANLLQSAKNVAVIGETGKQVMDRLMWNPNGERAKRNVEEVMTAWGRYNLVAHAEDADLVIVVTEFQKGVRLIGTANLVCEMRVYRGGLEPTADAPIVWFGDASEGFSQPSRKVAEKFRDFVKALTPRSPEP